MSFYLRKSVKLGPLRFNLSKSGVGVSVGIRGFRVGAGPRGNYVHIGRGGFYYRQTIAPAGDRRHRSSHGTSSESPVPVDRSLGEMEGIASGGVAQMRDSSSAALLAELDLKRQKRRRLPVALFAAAALLLAAISLEFGTAAILAVGILSCGGCGVAFYHDLLKKSAVMMYDLDDEATTAYRAFFDALATVGKAGGTWHVSARGNVHDPKYHAGAGQVVRRSRIHIVQHDPPFVRTNVSIQRIPTATGSLYFCPDRVLLYTGEGVGAVGYNELTFDVRVVRFIEEGSVPHDAKIVDHTWRYVNKSGGPDRRFKDNAQLPICEYEEIHVTSNSGLNELIQLSRTGLGGELQRAARQLAGILSIAAHAPKPPGVPHSAPSRKEPVLTPPPVATFVAPPPVAKLVVPPPVATAGAPAPSAMAAAHPIADAPFAPTPLKPLPTVTQLHESLFRLLCCVMVSDGRASSSEKAMIATLMNKAGATWEPQLIADRIKDFIAEVQTGGFRATFTRALATANLFNDAGRPDLLLKSVDALIALDGVTPQAEQEAAALIRARLMRVTPEPR